MQWEGSVWLVLGKPNPTLCLEIFHFRARSKIKKFQTGPRMCLSSTALPSMCEGLGSIPYHRNIGKYINERNVCRMQFQLLP